MKPSLVLAAIILFSAGVASAQMTPAKTEPAVAPSAKPGTTVSGVTVMANPKPQACASRDQQCIALVVAELKQRYPEELKRFCLQRAARAARTQVTNDQLLEDLGGKGPPKPTAFDVNSALKTACVLQKQ